MYVFNLSNKWVSSVGRTLWRTTLLCGSLWRVCGLCVHASTCLHLVFWFQFYRALNIRVPLIGLEVWTDRDQCIVTEEPNATLWSFLQWRQKLKSRKKHDNAQLLTWATDESRRPYRLFVFAAAAHECSHLHSQLYHIFICGIIASLVGKWTSEMIPVKSVVIGQLNRRQQRPFLRSSTCSTLLAPLLP